jgi:outer membrane receptor for ferrienterochelin and colicins
MNYSNPKDLNGDGFTDLTLQDRISLFNKLKFGNKLSLATRFVYEDRWGGQIQWNPKYRGGDQIYGESIYTNRFEFFGNYQFDKAFSFQFSFNNHDQNSVYGTTRFNANQIIGFGQFLWNKSFKKNDFMIGIAYRYSFYDDDTTATFNEGKELNQEEVTHLPGIFFQNEIKINAKNTVLLGARYDYNSIHGSIFTPRFNYKLNNVDNSSIWRLSLGSGYRIAQIFTEDHAALTGAREVVFLNNLAPEKSWNANLNFVQKIYLKQGIILNFDSQLFITEFSNKIVPNYDANPNQIVFDNLQGRSITQGVSLNMNALLKGGVRVNLGATFIDSYIEENGLKSIPYLTERFHGVWKLQKKINRNNLTIDLTGTITGPLKLPTLGDLDPRDPYAPTFSIVNLQITKAWNSRFETYGGVKNILDFTPPSNSIARSFDPFDRGVNFDLKGNAIASENNPYGLTFDPSYVYASNQGIRMFFGLRWNSL